MLHVTCILVPWQDGKTCLHANDVRLSLDQASHLIVEANARLSNVQYLC
jgi:hypothetical protein